MSEVDRAGIAAYPLGRDFISSIRLYVQHWLWKRQFGYLLHPSIPMTKGNVKIADVACGTGAWLLDLARDYPSAHLHGFDLSTSQFPHSEWLPKNVTLGTLDILKPIPDHLRGQYDVVHVGFLVLVVQNDDPLPVLDNLLALLKPHGYLQWDEVDFGGTYLQSPNTQVSHSALDELKSKVHSVLLKTQGINFSWVPKLESPFEKRHVSVLNNVFVKPEDDIALPWTLQQLMALAELIKSIEKGDQSESPGGGWWALYERAAKEVTNGASVRMGMASIVGRKALHT